MADLPQADWTDTLRELARFASDHELPAPLTVTFSGDDPRHVSVAVSGTGHAAWFEHFGQCHHTSGPGDFGIYHRSHGYLPNPGISQARVELTCFADAHIPSAVAS